MEQVQAILRHKFWILCGVVFILALVGWWMAAGALATYTTKRIGEIETAEKAIPSGPPISSDYSQKLTAVNTKQEQQVELARTFLWKKQEQVMVWPRTIEQYAVEAGYRGEFAPLARDIYRTSEPADIRRVWEYVRPFNPMTGDGLVVFPISLMPVRTWKELPPTSQEMWDNQEDLWLLTSLLQSINVVNGGDNSTRLDAAIHQILKLELRGGKRGEPIDAPAGGDGGMPMESGPGSSMMSGGLGGAAGRGALPRPTSADFPIKEEFGPQGNEMGMGMMGSSSSMDLSTDGGDGAATGPVIRRYIDDEEGAPFKTRGFYMVCLMDHRRIPSLIAELTSNEHSPWPAEVVRVQMVRINEDASTASTNMGSPGGFGSSMGSSDMSMSAPSYQMRSDGPGGFGTGASGVTDDMGFQNQNNPNAANDLTLQTKVASATAALQNALSDPNIAQVAIAGIYTIYTPPKKPETEAAPVPAPDGSVPVSPAEIIQTPAAPGTEAAPGTMPLPGDGTDATTEAGATPATGTPATPPGADAGTSPTTNATTPAMPPAGLETSPAPATPPPTDAGSPPPGNPASTTPVPPAGNTNP